MRRGAARCGAERVSAETKSRAGPRTSERWSATIKAGTGKNDRQRFFFLLTAVQGIGTSNYLCKSVGATISNSDGVSLSPAWGLSVFFPFRQRLALVAAFSVAIKAQRAKWETTTAAQKKVPKDYLARHLQKKNRRAHYFPLWTVVRVLGIFRQSNFEKMTSRKPPTP